MDTLDLKIKMIEMLIEAEDSEKVCFTRNFIKETGGTLRQIRDILTELKGNGMIDLDYCINEDGQLSGRGYVLTTRATQWSIREWLQKLKNIASPHDGKEQHG